MHPFADAEGITYRKTVSGLEKILRNGSAYYAGQDKGLRKKIDEMILESKKKDDPENDILRIDNIENDGIAEDVTDLKKALNRFKDTSGDLYMKIVKITNSAADEYNILGANTFCDNAELNIATKAEGKPVKNTDISEENENSFDTFLQMIVRKDDKGKLGFTSLMDQAMAKAFSKAPLPEDPVQATQERSIRLREMNDASDVIVKADEFVEAVSDISRITKNDMPEEIASLKNSVNQQKQKLRNEKIGMLDDVVDRLEHSKRWRSNSDEYKKMLDSANQLKTAVHQHSREYKSASAERKQELDNNLKKALEDTGNFTKDYIDEKTGGKAGKKFWTDKGQERTELARSLEKITKNLNEEFYPPKPKAKEEERQVNRRTRLTDNTFSDKSKRYADEYYALDTHSNFKACEDSLAKITALNMLLDLKETMPEDTSKSSKLYSDPVVNFLSERVKECRAFRDLDFDKCTDYNKAEERYNKISDKIIAPASEGYPIDAKYMDSVKRDMLKIKNFKEQLNEQISPSLIREGIRKGGMKI